MEEGPGKENVKMMREGMRGYKSENSGKRIVVNLLAMPMMTVTGRCDWGSE